MRSVQLKEVRRGILGWFENKWKDGNIACSITQKCITHDGDTKVVDGDK